MDFDIGSFIYILLTLVFIIIGSLGSRKKSKQSPTQGSPESNAGQGEQSDPLSENLKKLFGDFPGMETETRTPKQEMQEDEDFILDTPEGKIDDASEYMQKPGNEVGGEKLYKMEDHIGEIMKDTHVSLKTRTKQPSTFVKRALKDFDPRKGILYAEVFKPKYF